MGPRVAHNAGHVALVIYVDHEGSGIRIREGPEPEDGHRIQFHVLLCICCIWVSMSAQLHSVLQRWKPLLIRFASYMSPAQICPQALKLAPKRSCSMHVHLELASSKHASAPVGA
eukprot:1138770-Pelagomonas_calceolata.AAC.13